MKTQEISAQELEWIKFLINKIKAEELSQPNKQRFADKEAERQTLLAEGIVPVKNIDTIMI